MLVSFEVRCIVRLLNGASRKTLASVMSAALPVEETSMHRGPLGKPEDARRSPWNKGKLIGSKPRLRTKDVWSIRTKLQVEKRTQDLGHVQSSHRQQASGCGVVRPKVEDVAPHSMTVDRATVRRRKTGHAVRFELERADPRSG